MSLRRSVEYDNRGRLVRVVNYDDGIDHADASRATLRRNAMPKKTLSGAQERRLETLDKRVRKLEARTRRRLAEPVVAAAIDEGRIGRDEQARWLERAEEFGVDGVRDLLRERRPDRRLAAANAAAEVIDDDQYHADFARRFGFGQRKETI